MSEPAQKPDPRPSYRFGRELKLGGSREFEAVFDARVKKNHGPLTLFAIPNDLGHLRLGLSVSRRVGNAVMRNRIKRLIREAFRLCQHDWPTGYDVVVVVRPHEPAILAEYQRLLSAGIRSLHLEWERKRRREAQ
ncbi:MAG: ribonuclease P protein component [Planctomycetota bacterium]|nr:ribonuclease P protein component [Planctomycetota bacterium]